MSCKHIPEGEYKCRICEAGEIRKLQMEQAAKIKPLVDHVASGGRLEFLRDDGIWNISKAGNLLQLCISPDRYRPAK